MVLLKLLVKIAALQTYTVLDQIYFAPLLSLRAVCVYALKLKSLWLRRWHTGPKYFISKIFVISHSYVHMVLYC